MYAQRTEVNAARSEAEIKRMVMRHGATAFMSGTQVGQAAMVAFEMRGRRLRFVLSMPDLEDFGRTEKRRTVRTNAAQHQAWDQACNQRWRALLLVIKAKLEAVEAGISVFEEEFLAHIVLPDGNTVGQVMVPQVAQAYETGRPLRPLLEHVDGGRG